MLQIKHGQSREIVTDIFTQEILEQTFRKNRDCRIPSLNTLFYGSKSTSYEISKNWEITLVRINEFISLNSFKKEIRNWVPQNCPWRLRKQYTSGAGFLP